MSIIILLGLMYLQDAYSLTCIGNSSLDIMRSEFTLDNDSLTLRKISDKIMHRFVTSTICHVTIRIDYNQINGNVILVFGERTNYTGNYIGIETWIPLVKDNDSIISYIDYVCSLDDFCDQIFVNRWIHCLANIKYKSLQSELIYLLASSMHSGTCNAGGKLTNCSTGMCIAIYNKNTNNTPFRTGCRNNASMITSSLYVKMQSVEYQPMEYEELTYTCMSDKCNSQSTFRHVWKETANLFDFVKHIEDWLHPENILNRALEELQKEMKNQSYMRVTTSSDYSWAGEISFGCIYIILITMSCICCCMYCPRKSDGYATTPTSV